MRAASLAARVHPLSEYTGPRCPACRARIDGRSSIDGGEEAPPSPGDTTICIYCRSILVYTDEAGHARRMSDAEWRALPPEAKNVISRALGVLTEQRGRIPKPEDRQ